MHFLFSGEGSTDCGTGTFSDRVCTGDQVQPGPMMVLANQIVKSATGASPLDSGRCGLAARSLRNAAIRELKANKKNLGLPGPRRAKETQYFQRSARALARLATQWGFHTSGDVVAVLFHDNDDHQATSASLWKARKDAVQAGFREEGFTRGVAMIPRPTSEAWLLCALKDRPYEQCDTLEERSGSPNAKRPLKKELAEVLGTKPTPEMLCELVVEGKIDANHINMPSFNEFRRDLIAAIG